MKKLKAIVNVLDDAAIAIYEEYDENALVAGVVGFPDTQMCFTGVLSDEHAAGLMLTIIKGLGLELERISEEDAVFLDKIIEKFK